MTGQLYEGCWGVTRAGEKRWSMTWTHSLTLTKQRPESGQRRFGAFRIPGPQARYGVVLFGYALELMTQKALRR